MCIKQGKLELLQPRVLEEFRAPLADKAIVASAAARSSFLPPRKRIGLKTRPR